MPSGAFATLKARPKIRVTSNVFGPEVVTTGVAAGSTDVVIRVPKTQ
jgi:hypothetical protein